MTSTARDTVIDSGSLYESLNAAERAQVLKLVNEQTKKPVSIINACDDLIIAGFKAERQDQSDKLPLDLEDHYYGAFANNSIWALAKDEDDFISVTLVVKPFIRIRDVHLRDLFEDSFELSNRVEGRLLKFTLKVNETRYVSEKYPKITLGAEGFFLRCFLYNGIFYTATSTRINGRKSAWGNIPILDRFHQFGLPSREELFANDKDTWCYHFMCSCADSVTATSQVFDRYSGYITLIGATSVDPEADQPYYNAANIKIEDFQAVHTVNTDAVPVMNQVTLNYNQAIDVLRTGLPGIRPFNFADELLEGTLNTEDRLRIGEPVVVLVQSRTGDKAKLLRILPPSCVWRNELRNGDPSTRHRALALLKRAASITNNPDLIVKLPLRDRIVKSKWDPKTRTRTEVYEDSFILNQDSDYSKILDNSRAFQEQLVLDNFKLASNNRQGSTMQIEDMLKSRQNLVRLVKAIQDGFVSIVNLDNPEIVKRELGTIQDYEFGSRVQIFQKGPDDRIYDLTGLAIKKLERVNSYTGRTERSGIFLCFQGNGLGKMDKTGPLYALADRATEAEGRLSRRPGARGDLRAIAIWNEINKLKLSEEYALLKMASGYQSKLYTKIRGEDAVQEYKRRKETFSMVDW